ncbi:hypothetical protein BD309DRAFT_64972 [Dichomitus squalens]|nr:hypothetical protein BD309DRAFT_64972 [Dichomitus squalens]
MSATTSPRHTILCRLRSRAWLTIVPHEWHHVLTHSIGPRWLPDDRPTGEERLGSRFRDEPVDSEVIRINTGELCKTC